MVAKSIRGLIWGLSSIAALLVFLLVASVCISFIDEAFMGPEAAVGWDPVSLLGSGSPYALLYIYLPVWLLMAVFGLGFRHGWKRRGWLRGEA